MNMSSSKIYKSRQIDLSESSKELIIINLNEKISDCEKNEKIREIIRNNISNNNNKQIFQKRIKKNFIIKI